MRITIEIELGNDAMQTQYDAGQAVWRALCGSGDKLAPDDEGSIRDDNGNTVGTWTVTA